MTGKETSVFDILRTLAHYTLPAPLEHRRKSHYGENCPAAQEPRLSSPDSPQNVVRN